MDGWLGAGAGTLSLLQACRRAHCGPPKMRRLIVAGAIRAYRPGREWRINAADLDAYLAGDTQPRETDHA
jgi:excisionase family DNA binding protein